MGLQTDAYCLERQRAAPTERLLRQLPSVLPIQSWMRLPQGVETIERPENYDEQVHSGRSHQQTQCQASGQSTASRILSACKGQSQPLKSQ